MCISYVTNNLCGDPNLCGGISQVPVSTNPRFNYKHMEISFVKNGDLLIKIFIINNECVSPICGSRMEWTCNSVRCQDIASVAL